MNISDKLSILSVGDSAWLIPKRKKMEEKQTSLVLLTGATGYIGRRLRPLIEKGDYRLRCLARNPGKLQPQVGHATEVVKGDVLDHASLKAALSDVKVAYYLVHSMSSADFERQDRTAAENFASDNAASSEA